MKQISCKRAVDYISKKEEGKLGIWQQFHLWRHLTYCNLCRYFAKQSEVIAKAFAGFKEEEDMPRLSEEDKQHIIEVIANESKSE